MAPAAAAPAAADQAAAPAAPGSLLDALAKPDAAAADPAVAQAEQLPALPEWDVLRKIIAAGDEKFEKEMGRYKSLESWVKSGRELRQKMSSGEYRRAKLGEDASDADRAAWRKDNGIPEKPEGYVAPAIEGFEWGEDDKPILDSFFAHAHAKDTPQEYVDTALQWYAQFERSIAEQTALADKQAVEQGAGKLRAMLGGETEAGVALVRRLLTDAEGIPGGVGSRLATARYADGRRVVDDPDMVAWLVEKAKQRYGTTSLMVGDPTVAQHASRKAELEKALNENWEKYMTHRQPNGKTMQEEHLELMRAEDARRRRA